MLFISYNGKIFPAGEPVLKAGNRSFKWGEGLFETIKVFKGTLLHGDYHFDRLFLGLKMLDIPAGDSFNRESLAENILGLCRKNNCAALARVRLAVYRDEEEKAAFLLEALPLPEKLNHWDPVGWTIDLYPHARKTADAFANFKTASFLPYVLAERWARQNSLDDALVLNSENNICDSSRANLFLLKQGNWYTPALHQGCINGVIRRYLLEELKKSGYQVHQQTVTETDLLEADEIFLSNSILDIQWVKKFREKEFSHEETRSLYDRFFSTLYH